MDVCVCVWTLHRLVYGEHLGAMRLLNTCNILTTARSFGVRCLASMKSDRSRLNMYVADMLRDE